MGCCVWAHVSLVPVLFVLVRIDQDRHLLPDVFTLPALGISALLVGAMTRATGDFEALTHSGLSVATVVLGLWLIAEAPGQPLGFGDVKWAAVLALHAGVYHWSLGMTMVILAIISGGLQATWLIAHRRIGRHEAIAFGPHLAVGWMTTMATTPMLS